MVHGYLPTSPISWQWVSFNGPDAQDFLQRLSTIQVETLPMGEGSPGCFLSPQGKFKSYFFLWKYADQEFAFEFDAGKNDHWKKELFEFIEHYTFGEKLKLSDVTESDKMECRWILFDEKETSSLPKEIQSLLPGKTFATNEEIRFCHHGKRTFGKMWITLWGRKARLMQWWDQNLSEVPLLSLEDLEKWRVENLGPWVDAEVLSEHSPLEAGVPEAVTPGKGCYPGQEVIERIFTYGSPPKRLIQIESDHPLKTGSSIYSVADSPMKIGIVTTVSSKPNSEGSLALGYIRKTLAKEGTEIRIEDKPATVRKVAPYALSL